MKKLNLLKIIFLIILSNNLCYGQVTELITDKEKHEIGEKIELIIEKIPDFMQFHNVFIVKKDTLERMCFCFDKLDKQLDIDNFYNNVNQKYCKVFERKYIKGAKGYWIYEMFVKEDATYKIIAEYSKIDNTNHWLMKKYKNNVVISENKIKLTDSIIATSKTYKGSNINKNSIPTIRHLMKTETTN